MSEIKVSELPEASQLNNGDLIMIVQGSANKKIAAGIFNTNNDSRLDALETDTSDLKTANTFSTSETVIGKWINNKPLYRKVYELGTLPNATSKTWNSGLSNFVVTKLYGVCSASNNTTLPLPYVATAAGSNIVLNINASGQILVDSASTDRSGYNGIAIVEYYKTTDSAS